MAKDKVYANPPLAESIKLIHGTLYEINHADIYIAKQGDAGSNIRYLSGDDEILGVGFDKANMEKLNHTIKESGLHNPLICRWVVIENVLTVQLVDGERRWRTLERLLSKNEKVYDPASKKVVPARDIYTRILIRVYDAQSDKETIRLSYQDNHSRVAFNDKVDIRLVEEMRAKKFTDEEILDITGQKSDWLRDTDKLIAAFKNDLETLDALSRGVIRREAALVFIGIEDLDLRRESVRAAAELATTQHKKRILAIDASIQNAKERLEEAAADEVNANFDHDEEAVTKAKEKAAAAAKKIEEKTRQKQEAKPEVGSRVARKAGKNVGAARPQDGKPRSMSNKKAIVEFVEPLTTLIKAHGIVEDEEECTCHPNVLKCMLDVANAMATSDLGQVMRLVRKWGKHFDEHGYSGEKE